MPNKLRTVSDIKTAVRSKVRGKPRLRGSEYLEMFLLEKNRARLEQEKENVEKRRRQIERDVSVIDEELQTLEDALSGEKTEETAVRRYKKTVPNNPMKVMSIDY